MRRSDAPTGVFDRADGAAINKAARELRQGKSNDRCCIPALAGLACSQSVVPGDGVTIGEILRITIFLCQSACIPPPEGRRSIPLNVARPCAVPHQINTPSMASSSPLPRIALVAAIILTGVAGGKNYLNRLEIKRVSADLETAKTQVASSAPQIETATKEAKAAADKLKEVVAARAADEEKVTNASATIAKAQKDAEEAKAQAQAKETEIAGLKEQLAKAGAAPAPAAADPAAEAKLADAQKAAAEKEQVVKLLQTKAEEAEKKVANFEADAALRAKQAMKPGLEGKVLAVNPSWNFVVLSMGDKQGVVSGASLIVKRGGSMVAKLRVTSVEPSTSIADVQAGSTAKGSTIQPGDVVIFPGS